MATVNIGRLKFKWQGNYSSGTAYVVDDVVYHGGSSYVCINDSTGNAPTNTSYWQKMAQGSDLGSLSGITQGDVVYYNGTDWARLAAGTSGQFLKTNGSGANPVWDDVDLGTAAALDVGTSANNIVQLDSSARLPAVDGSALTNIPDNGKVLQHVIKTDATGANLGNRYRSYTTIAALELNITPVSSSSYFIVKCHLHASNNHHTRGGIIYRLNGGSDTYLSGDSITRSSAGITWSSDPLYQYPHMSWQYEPDTNTTSASSCSIKWTHGQTTSDTITFRPYLFGTNSSNYMIYNSTNSNSSADGTVQHSTIEVWEMSA